MPMSPRLLRPRQGGDPDALRYIAAVQTADGQPLEAGVRKAISDFVIGCKADGIWSALKASCILAGARTLAGALTPLVGAAPTNFNFVSGDYNRKTGLVGNGSSKYLATGRNLASSDSQNNHHAAVFPTELPTEGTTGADDFGPLLAARASGTAVGSVQVVNNGPVFGTAGVSQNRIQVVSTETASTRALARAAGKLAALSRSASGSFVGRSDGASTTFSSTSVSLASAEWFVFARTVGGSGEKYTKSRLAFYSIGQSLDLALLDARVTALINAIGAALAPNYADPDVNAYITAVELADGGLMLEPGVRDAINAFITGCKADGIWSALKASCILAGARTLAGALTPLVGAAPTNNNFVSGDYNRKTGLVGDGTSKFLNSNRANNADPQNSQHLSVFCHSVTTAGRPYMGAGDVSNGSSRFGISTATSMFNASRSAVSQGQSGTSATGFCGLTRSVSANFVARNSGANQTLAQASQTPTSDSVFVFARNNGSGTAAAYTDARFAFYSIGESLNLALLDSRVTALYNAIGAAIP